MNISRKYILLGVIVLVLGVIGYLIYSNSIYGGAAGTQFTLKVWGVENKDVFAPIADGYTALRPGVSIEYKQFDPGTYKEALVNALAGGAGPDIFYIKNHDIPAEVEKLSPANPEQFNLAQLNNLFPAVVGQDMVVSGNLLYALPLYVDTLTLLYNKELFDQNAIVYPPKTWAEFQALIRKLTQINERGQIVRAAAAIGGSEKTVDAGVDLLLALAMQNTPRTTNAGEQALVDAFGTQAGGDAFAFYLQFANSASTAYTWNDDQQNSIDSFSAGNTAMLFNYQAAIPVIKKKSPFINIGVAPLPQIGGESGVPVTYANYYALAVSKQTKLPTWAWDFVIQATTNEGLARSYLASAGHPPALKALIAEKIGDPDTSVFAASALIARSWYHINNEEIHAALNDAIQEVLTGKSTARAALETATAKMEQLYQ